MFTIHFHLSGRLPLVLAASALLACTPEAKTLRLSCAEGNVADCNELGYRLAIGDHVLRDYAWAAELLLQACVGGLLTKAFPMLWTGNNLASLLRNFN